MYLTVLGPLFEKVTFAQVQNHIFTDSTTICLCVFELELEPDQTKNFLKLKKSFFGLSYDGAMTRKNVSSRTFLLGQIIWQASFCKFQMLLFEKCLSSFIKFGLQCKMKAFLVSTEAERTILTLLVIGRMIPTHAHTAQLPPELLGPLHMRTSCQTGRNQYSPVFMSTG